MMMITAREEVGHFAVIHDGRNMTNVVDIERYRKKVEPQMEHQSDFAETVPTDFGGLNERRNYTPEGMRTGMLLFIASAIVTVLALIVIFSSIGAQR